MDGWKGGLQATAGRTGTNTANTARNQAKATDCRRTMARVSAKMGFVESIPPEALLADYPPDMQAIAHRLRAIVRRAEPTAVERVRPGWRLIGYDLLVGRRSVYFAYVAPEAEHVHLGFEWGVLMDDPDRRLLGEGITRQVRWLTLRSEREIDEPAFVALVREAARVATMSRAERQLRAMDLDPP